MTKNTVLERSTTQMEQYMKEIGMKAINMDKDCLFHKTVVKKLEYGFKESFKELLKQ